MKNAGFLYRILLTRKYKNDGIHIEVETTKTEYQNITDKNYVLLSRQLIDKNALDKIFFISNYDEWIGRKSEPYNISNFMLWIYTRDENKLKEYKNNLYQEHEKIINKINMPIIHKDEYENFDKAPCWSEKEISLNRVIKEESI